MLDQSLFRKLDIYTCFLPDLLVLLKSHKFGLILDKNQRNLLILTKEGKVKIKYSEIAIVWSTFEAKSKKESIEILNNFEKIKKIDNGICVLENGLTIPFEDMLNKLNKNI